MNSLKWALGGLLLSGPCAWAQDPGSPKGVPREILCLYDGEGHSRLLEAEVCGAAALILNHLGWTCRYQDLRSGLPEDSELAQTRGILLWVTQAEVPRPDELCRWLLRQAGGGKPLVLFLQAPFVDAETQKPVSARLFQELLSAVGMECTETLPAGTAAYQKVKSEPGGAEFERTADPYMPLPARFRSTGDPARVWLRVRRDDPPALEIDVVSTARGGGFGLSPWVLYVQPRIAQSQWRIDPFRFFEEAFGGTGEPRPDLSTAQGRRIFFSHVDGDGFENLIHDPVGEGEKCASLFKREYLERYRLPVTVSVIAYDMEKDQENRKLARELFELGWVEPAVHTYAHPLDWSKGTVSYDKIPGYAFDVQKETRGAVQSVQSSVLPEGRKVGLFLWSGSRNPSERAIELVDEMGLGNLNVDDSFLDAGHPSYTQLLPAFLPVGRRMQFNARSSAELLYTGGWTRNFWAFSGVIETFKRTESPERICPVNLYHHFYLVERKAARDSLHAIYQWVLAQPLHPITASAYVELLKGFLSARISRFPDGSWGVEEAGACRTIRFDREPRNVDLELSRGVLGFRHEGGRLYVHLSGPRARIVLSEKPPERPYLVWSSGEARLEAASGGKVELGIDGWGPVSWRVGGLSAKTIRVTISTGTPGKGEERVVHPEGGEVGLELPASSHARFLLEPQ